MSPLTEVSVLERAQRPSDMKEKPKRLQKEAKTAAFNITHRKNKMIKRNFTDRR